jgi:hypothetical protein
VGATVDALAPMAVAIAGRKAIIEPSRKAACRPHRVGMPSCTLRSRTRAS